MKPRIGNEGGFVLMVTLMSMVVMAIGAAAYLHLTKTQVVQVRAQLRSTKAFFAAETGLEKAMGLLKNDFYYTPKPMKASWADDKIYTATGFIDLASRGYPRYLSVENPDYDNEFYTLLDETDYYAEKYGLYKATYQVDLSNLQGWTDRVWIKATGRYYEKNGDGTFTQKAERRVLALVRAKSISPWDNVIFAGEGQNGRVINGNVDIRGSVHLLGTSLLPDDWAMELNGAGNIGNNYLGMPAELAARVSSIAKTYSGEIMDSLEAEVRVQHGKVALSGSSQVGAPNVPGNGVKETVEGVHVRDGYAGNQGDLNVYSDNGSKVPYDLDAFEQGFPRLSEPYPEDSTVPYMKYLQANALVISDPAELSQLQDIDPTSKFSYGDENTKGEISMDGDGHLRIRGVVVVRGDVNFNKFFVYEKRKLVYVYDTVEYQGRGSLTSTGSVGINCNVITQSISTYPKEDILGVMAADTISFNSAQINVMGVFYAENQIVSEKQTSVAGTFFSNYFDMGQNVPSIYQVPETAQYLPPGMIGDARIWTVKRMTWREV